MSTDTVDLVVKLGSLVEVASGIVGGCVVSKIVVSDSVVTFSEVMLPEVGTVLVVKSLKSVVSEVEIDCVVIGSVCLEVRTGFVRPSVETGTVVKGNGSFVETISDVSKDCVVGSVDIDNDGEVVSPIDGLEDDEDICCWVVASVGMSSVVKGS